VHWKGCAHLWADRRKDLVAGGERCCLMRSPELREFFLEFGCNGEPLHPCVDNTDVVGHDDDFQVTPLVCLERHPPPHHLETEGASTVRVVGHQKPLLLCAQQPHVCRHQRPQGMRGDNSSPLPQHVQVNSSPRNSSRITDTETTILTRITRVVTRPFH
jgi:hypothetical protein